MVRFNEDEPGRRSDKNSDYPDELDDEAEEPGGGSAIGNMQTGDTDIEAMLNAKEPSPKPENTQQEYSSKVEDKTSQWGGAEAVAIEEPLELNPEYFDKLNNQIRNLQESNEVEQYIEEVDSEFENHSPYQFDPMVSTGLIGKRISVSPEDAETDLTQDSPGYEVIEEALDKVVSSHSPKKLMAFTKIGESDGPISQTELYESENSYAQPTVSLVTDDWEEDGLVEKYNNGDLETTDLGKSVYEVTQNIEKDVFEEDYSF